MKKIISIIGMALAAVLMLSCGNCQKGDGVIISMERNNLPSFTEVVAQGDFEVVLKTGPQYKAVLTTNENLHDEIDIVVSGKVLYIKLKDGECIKKWDKLKVEVYAPEYKKVELDGDGTLSNEGTLQTNGVFYAVVNGSGYANLQVNADSVFTYLNGSARLSIGGNTYAHFSDLDGSGLIDGEALLATNATASLDGSGQISLHCTSTLTAGVNGSGLIRYAGHPATVDKHINGSGTIIEM